MRAIAALALALGGCVTVPPQSADGLAWARIGERVYVDGPHVTPRVVLEDSRCPADVDCVWAGRVRLAVTVHLGAGDIQRELTLSEPIAVADGTLELAEVRPPRASGEAPKPADYRFGLRFAGGL